MCKAKADGGKRCFSHTMKEKQSVIKQLETQNKLLDFLYEREEKSGQLTLTQADERTMREEKITDLTERAGQIDEELIRIKESQAQREADRLLREEQRKQEARAEAEARIKRGHQGEGRGRPRLNLTEREMATLKERASEEGKTVSRYVQDLTDEEPKFLNVGADSNFKRINANPDWDKAGRKPQSNHGATIVSSPTAGMSAEKFDRLTAEAEAFNLTTADYLRRRILGLDPRTRGAHMSYARQDAEIELLSHYESSAGLGAKPSSADLWSVYSARADEIQKSRASHVKKKDSGKVSPIAA